MSPCRLAGYFFLVVAVVAATEHTRDLEISEGAAVGTKIGFIGDGVASGPPYLIVPVGSHVDTDLQIDHTTGEIRTKVPLDRETRASYSLVAIPMSGDNVKVIVKVSDENDNAPTFPTPIVHIEFPENTPRDVKRTLPPAKDLDLDLYNTQKYNIVSGNKNNAFRLSSHRERDGVLYLDLQINGFLDRETCDSYNLVIEALDGGSPPLRGEMTVNITIQDVNDNPPVFNQTRYFASVPENSTVGTAVMQVSASDADIGDNSRVEYSINRRQSDKETMFKIDAATGTISVNKPLDFETKELHELVVVARDRGLQPLEATTFVSIKVVDVNDNQPTINVIFLSDDATPKISESAQPGEFVARISVRDPDSKQDYANVNVTLSGGDGKFGLTTRDNVVYLVIVSLPLDRESQPNYTLNVVATDTGTPPLHASKTINLRVTDVNDNSPRFERDSYDANVMEVSDPGTSVVRVIASDEDDGDNGVVTYSLRDPRGWFQIDPKSGLVTTRAHVDCETDPLPKLTVVATDNGFPPLSSTATVLVTIHDVNDNEPIFDQSFYNVSVAENETEGKCVLKVSATDPDCGVNAVVSYTLGDGFAKLKEFKVRSASGEICIGAPLDYETRNMYEFPVIATDRGGLSTTAMVKIQVADVNDNRPVFYPSEYNVSLRDGGASSSATTPVVVVSATDPDSGKFGAVTYRIVAGNEAGLFRIDRATGEIFVNRPHQLSTRNQPYHRLKVSATDGANLKSLKDAEVFISVIDSAQKPPIFEQPRYTFHAAEDVKRDYVVGHVRANVVDDGRSNARYSIYSGDPDGFFRIDAVSGAIKVAGRLDHETRSTVLLNVQATSGNPPIYGHTQVNIDIDDINDNVPEFESAVVRISVPENAELGVPFYAAHASDKDSGSNGVVRYRLASNNGGTFKIDPKLGHLTLAKHLDFETTQRHTLVVTATDSGSPPLSANLTVMIEVQDMNDNPPVFEKNSYTLNVMESLPVNSQIAQFTAVDADTGNNARITYRLVTANRSVESVFGIFPNSGWLYLKENLDREAIDGYGFLVSAKDNGTPSQTATVQVTVVVLDANDNDPVFDEVAYEFRIEENLARGASVGKLRARDEDAGVNAAVRYSLAPANGSFQINSVTGEITTKEVLDREVKPHHDLIAEARDQGVPPRSTRVPVKISILDVNDNAPEIVDPQEDVVSVREEQSPGTEVVKIRAIDPDNGANSSITYSLIKTADDSDSFVINPTTGMIRTQVVLDHEEKTIYRLTVAATDAGTPPKQTVRMLRVEVLDLNDNRPTFTSSSLTFVVGEDARIGQVVGSVTEPDDDDAENVIGGSTAGHVTYTMTSASSIDADAFDIERNTGRIVVARELDRETRAEYKLDVRALDTSAMNNPQSSAISVKIEVADVNDNAPRWPQDPITVQVGEETEPGTSVCKCGAVDADSAANGELRYRVSSQFPRDDLFSVDPLTGTLTLSKTLDYEAAKEHIVVVEATDQASNVSERLSGLVTVRVSVIDYNDHAPNFVFPRTRTAFIDKDISVGMMVAHVVAVDDDAGDNGRVTYVMAGSKDSSLFALGYDTGYVTLAKPLPVATVTYVLNVTATDHGIPTRQTSTELELVVRDSSDYPSKFLDAVYEADVLENVPTGTHVAQLRTGQNRSNVTYVIPAGVADDSFEVTSPGGKIFTKKTLDREAVDRYTFPVYASDHDSAFFDVTRVKVIVVDVNDNAPTFLSGSCYRLSIPENGAEAVVHTVVAKDADSGPNGDVSYTISGGNARSKFSIDPKTGDLTARSLDREAQSRYQLTVTARDRGTPPLYGQCNVTVFVEDQNDNDPLFDLSKYSTTIPEDVPVDTSVLRVHAVDADAGLNARIVYYLANESHWSFRIDNKTGVITTAGLFDRERQKEYNFMVVAMDCGKYNTRSAKVPVTVHIGDVNDNKPIFTEYPFRQKVAAYIQPGQTILKVTATDVDEGPNADIVYNMASDSGKFRINPNTGVLTATQSLASNSGKVIFLHITATDKGNPSKSSTGLVEIAVGDLPVGAPQLRFQNDSYYVTIPENLEQFRDVAQVGAVRTDGRRQKILYSFGTGNEENIFVIGAESGMIQVRDPKNLDYELHHEIRLVVEAKTEGGPDLHGYCDVTIRLTDRNDNAPKFTQQQYTASVWEGNKKGSFVMQVVASDADQDRNSRILYHIVDGNHDNAFKIEPAFSGILKTNIVLDREIRDNYRLTVIATDEGVPQMTGTTKVRVNVVDVNDNRPTFPPRSVVKVGEDAEVGTVLTTITANDVDTYPELTYNFTSDTDPEYVRYFGIDRYTGKILLKRRLDFEAWQEYELGVSASDEVHVARTTLTIKVTDVNDNAPVFSQMAYEATLPDVQATTTSLTDVVAVNATDPDSGGNGIVRYSIVNPRPSVFVGPEDGIVRVNASNVSSSEDIVIAVKAEDSGTPILHSVATVRIKVGGRSALGGPGNEYKTNVAENATVGTVVVHLTKAADRTSSDFKILSGNDDDVFEISSGALTLTKRLDREQKDEYDIVVSLDGGAVSLVHVLITVDDVNDNAPVFVEADRVETVPEDVPVDASITRVSATDADAPGTPNADVIFDIASGDAGRLFRIDSQTGVLYVNSILDYDSGDIEYHLVVRACDRGDPPLCSLIPTTITLEDVNDNDPIFPFAEYVAGLEENEPVGTAIFTARAVDLDKGPFGKINYSINGGPDAAWFAVDVDSGIVSAGVSFDYERRTRYNFAVTATDAGGKSSTVKVQVNVESRDEFYPQFTERTYRYTLATSVPLIVGYVVGFVVATDKDKGPDGRVVYQLTAQHAHFKINRTSGAVLIKRKLDDASLGREVSLVVSASSGRQGSLTNMTVVEIVLDPLADPGTNLAINATVPRSGISDWALGLVISLALLVVTFGAAFVFLHVRNKRNRKNNKPTLGSETVSTSNNYVDPSAFDTIRGGAGPNQFAPPKYDEIPPYGAAHPASSNSGAATTSELSGSEQSGSSGRGSAEDGEDGEDEEIRMINEGPLQRDSGIHRQNGDDDDDNLSDLSVRNTQEYLARLGIGAHAQTATRLCSDARAGSSKESLHHHQLRMFDEEAANAENDITQLIYAKLNDVTGSTSSADEGGGVGASMDHVMAIGGYGEVPAVTHQPSMNGSLSSIVHSEEELAGSYNWDYLLDWGPQYQPLAHVFSEIARLKDDAAAASSSVHSGASAASSVKSKTSVAKSVPPPLITSVAPRSIAMPALSARAAGHAQMVMLPRSPINHDASGTTFSTSTAMSPSFSPSLSPLATKSPSISPLVAPGLSTAHHVMARQQQPPTRGKTVVDAELRL
ncbi:protein dachsous [Cylas formicarius]|uniref:protein dachsous n=1 Tax=Cylas formicarius TaxID=197179 RepID=UPI0029585292|nr:protein dachsous [Cylas formicarius]